MGMTITSVSLFKDYIMPLLVFFFFFTFYSLITRRIEGFRWKYISSRVAKEIRGRDYYFNHSLFLFTSLIIYHFDIRNLHVILLISYEVGLSRITIIRYHLLYWHTICNSIFERCPFLLTRVCACLYMKILRDNDCVGFLVPVYFLHMFRREYFSI